MIDFVSKARKLFLLARGTPYGEERDAAIRKALMLISDQQL